MVARQSPLQKAYELREPGDERGADRFHGLPVVLSRASSHENLRVVSDRLP